MTPTAAIYSSQLWVRSSGSSISVCRTNITFLERRNGSLSANPSPRVQRVTSRKLNRIYIRNSLASEQGLEGSTRSGDQKQSLAPKSDDDVTSSTTPIDELSLEDKEARRRAKISSANKGKRPWNKGRKHSPETIAKIKARTKAAMKRPEVKAKTEAQAKKQVGVRLDADHRVKIKEGLKQFYKENPRQRTEESLRKEEEKKAAREQKRKEREELKAKKLKEAEEAKKKKEQSRRSSRSYKSSVHRQRISEALQARWQDPEYRAKVTGSIRGRKRTPKAETKAGKAPAEVEAPPRPEIDDKKEKLGAALRAQAKLLLVQAEQAATKMQEKAASGQPKDVLAAEEAVRQVAEVKAYIESSLGEDSTVTSKTSASEALPRMSDEEEVSRKEQNGESSAKGGEEGGLKRAQLQKQEKEARALAARRRALGRRTRVARRAQ